MNITKAIATEVAEKLIQKQGLELNELKDSLKVKFEKIVIDATPKDVVDFYKKYPNYVETRQSFQLSGNGFDYKYLNTKSSIPAFKSSFQPNERDAIILHGILNEIDKKEKEYKKLFSEIEIALFSLRTYKRVEETFPEAFLLLPNKITTSLSVNISDLRQKIK
jgi:hypothetical protein